MALRLRKAAECQWTRLLIGRVFRRTHMCAPSLFLASVDPVSASDICNYSGSSHQLRGLPYRRLDQAHLASHPCMHADRTTVRVCIPYERIWINIATSKCRGETCHIIESTSYSESQKLLRRTSRLALAWSEIFAKYVLQFEVDQSFRHLPIAAGIKDNKAQS